jgi:predicted transcriptional regulator
MYICCKILNMKSQDIVILLKLLLVEETEWRFASLAQALQMSSSTVFAALNRAALAGLYHKNSKTVHREALLEFLIYGLKYVFPVEVGKVVKGIPTAHSAAPLMQYIVSELDIYVWKSAYGNVKGQSITPLYASVPQFVQEDAPLYEFLALIDALRIGKAREKQLAKELLMQKIMHYES